jgi:signal transduction histidine kinase
MAFDWFGATISLIIIFALILIVVAKLQGDRVVDVLQQMLDFIKGAFGR